jgi:hypothetical protein
VTGPAETASTSAASAGRRTDRRRDRAMQVRTAGLLRRTNRAFDGSGPGRVASGGAFDPRPRLRRHEFRVATVTGALMDPGSMPRRSRIGWLGASGRPTSLGASGREGGPPSGSFETTRSAPSGVGGPWAAARATGREDARLSVAAGAQRREHAGPLQRDADTIVGRPAEDGWVLSACTRNGVEHVLRHATERW